MDFLLSFSLIFSVTVVARLDAPTLHSNTAAMIVYGDPEFSASARNIILALQGSSRALQDIDRVRALLIQCGQFEQAIADYQSSAGEFRAIRAEAESLTDAAADFFLSFLVCGKESWDDRELRRHLETLLARLALTADVSLKLKVPEGYEFYSLYPEQYVDAARRWAEHHTNHSSIVVVGLRSIGTSLSAVVAAALRTTGREVRRMTIRPTGHAFDRCAGFGVRFSSDVVALVVDEGPGISGSSMASVAEALMIAGVSRKNMVFFPGNPNEPGPAASDNVRAWWSGTTRIFTPLAHLAWHGRNLQSLLLERTAAICGTSAPLEIIDLSAGMWRNVVYSNETEWPAVCVGFERQKFLCRTKSGFAVLWKFAGHGSFLRPPEGVQSLSADQTQLVLGFCNGFVALPWLDGKPLARADFSPQLLIQMAQHIIDFAGPRLAASEAKPAIDRIADMLICNSKEALGDEARGVLENLREPALELEVLPTYGDGHLAPHEWIRTRSGKTVKTDNFGHDVDHTVIGRQPILWDIAGLMMEWSLDSTNRDLLITAMSQRGIEVKLEGLRFYCAAYAAFRMGQCVLCAEFCNGKEKGRLCAAAEYYRSHLANLIAENRRR